MKQKGFVVIAIVVLLAIIGLVLAYHFTFESDIGYNKPQLINTPTPTEKLFPSPTATPILSVIDWNKYLNKTTWKYFNFDYTSHDRNLRFRYPSVFSVEDVDSGSVQLINKGNIYFHIEDMYLNSPGDSLYKKIISGFHYREENISRYSLFSSSKEVYKITLDGPGACGGGYYQSSNWACFVGDKFAVAVTNPVPDEIVKILIDSMEFKK